MANDEWEVTGGKDSGELFGFLDASDYTDEQLEILHSEKVSDEWNAAIQHGGESVIDYLESFEDEYGFDIIDEFDWDDWRDWMGY